MAIYIMVSYYQNASFLLLMPGICLEMVSLVKWFRELRTRKGNKDTKKDNIKRSVHMVVRSFSYFFLFSWTVVFERQLVPVSSLTIGVYPIFIYSIISILTDFFVKSWKLTASFYVLFYKGCRVLVYVQMLILASKCNSNGVLIDGTSMQQYYWPMFVGSILMLPVIVVILIYYLYTIIEMLGSSTSNKRLHCSRLVG